LISTVQFSVTGTSSLNCSNSETISIKVNACTDISIIENTQNNLFQVFPNPSNGNFEMKSEIKLVITIINEMGQNIKTALMDETNNYKLCVHDLTPGIYFVLAENNFQKQVFKIIVIK
jgi:hypothetical protein